MSAVCGTFSGCGAAIGHSGRFGKWQRKCSGSAVRFLLPCSALAGSTLLLLGDLAAKVILPPAILPIGAITSLLGAPLFLLLIFRGEALR